MWNSLVGMLFEVARRKAKGLGHTLAVQYGDWRCRQAWHPYSLPDGYERVYFFHIRKTGGTSINRMFLSLGGEFPQKVYDRVSNGPYFGTVSGDKVFAGWTASLIRRGQYFYAFSHIPQHRLGPLPGGTFTITCLRDPVHRVLSLYKMLYQYKVENVAHPGMKRQKKWLGNSFGDFLDRIPREELLNQVYMFSETFNVTEAFQNISDCSHVMFTEDFDIGIDILSKKLGLELTPMHTRAASMEPPVTDRERCRLREMMQPEYQLYRKLREALCEED